MGHYALLFSGGDFSSPFGNFQRLARLDTAEALNFNVQIHGTSFAAFAAATQSHWQEAAMVSTEQVEHVLADIRPFLQADGVNIEVMGMEGNSALARLSLPTDASAGMRLTLWTGIEEGLRERIPGFDSLRLL